MKQQHFEKTDIQTEREVKRVMEFVNSDTRSPEEIFSSIRDRIQFMSGDKLSDQEASDATRNLIGFCETIMGLNENRNLY